jgi:hypothetical protein
MEQLALTIPGPSLTPVKIVAPPGVPTGIGLGPLVTSIIGVLLMIGIVLSLMFMLYGGLYWIQSKGDKETLDRARRIILYSIIGLIVMALSFVIVSVVAQALGVQSLVGN